MNEERNSAIGQELQQARLDKGLSLDDIQQSTKIQKRYLAAIESGQFDQLPGAFYERAFVRQYATAVGIDAVAFMQKYENEDAETPQPDLSAARVDADNVTRAGMHQNEETVADKTRSMMPKIIIGVVIVAIIAIIWAVVSSFAGSANQKTSRPSQYQHHKLLTRILLQRRHHQSHQQRRLLLVSQNHQHQVAQRRHHQNHLLKRRKRQLKLTWAKVM